MVAVHVKAQKRGTEAESGLAELRSDCFAPKQMNERQYEGNLIRPGWPHCAGLELVLAARSTIVSRTGRKTLPGPRELCIIQHACLEDSRVEEGRKQRRRKRRRIDGWKGKAGA